MENPAAPAAWKKFRLRNGNLDALRLRRVFDLFDRDGDGEITLDEMASGLEALGLGANRAWVVTTASAYIPADVAGIGFDDFQLLHLVLGNELFGPEKEVDDEGDMKEVFRVFDEDGDGFISAAELQAVLKKLGLPEARKTFPRGFAFRLLDWKQWATATAGAVSAFVRMFTRCRWRRRNLATVQEMICNVDGDRDGRVDFVEFKSMMQGIIVSGA